MAQTTVETHKTPKSAGTPEKSRKDDAVAKAKDSVNTAKDSVNNAYETVKEAGTEAVGRAQAAGEAAISSSTDMVRGAQSELDSVVRRNPTVAVVGALGLGVLLGMALRARN